ncbi:MAG TPA: hypothetical protein P5243_02690, partial [Bacteroidales bacterium]|nr:hypothetical protein [Bacteroidales bacterium]
MKKILAIVIITLFCIKMYSQQSSRNGIYWPTKDTIRCLVVFVSYYNAPDSTKTIPANANTYFNATMPTDRNQLVGITKYFYEASFGKLVVLGDYVNKVIVVNSSAINNNYNDHLSVFPALDLALANDSTTKSGFSINRHFDNWSYFENGIPKVKTPNKFIDVLVMIHIPSTRYDGSGYTKQTPIISEILDMDGVSIYTSSSRGLDVVRHELAHSLLGGNSYHSGGGNSGERWTLSPMGGYSLLSGSNKNFNSINGWDRWRLGWFSDSAISKKLEIYALNEQQNLIQSDIDSSIGTQTFILRDFTKYGDAIRIKLPYIGSQSDGLYPVDQWLWIENHQVLPNTTEALNENGVRPAGIRINYQIGKNDLNYNEPVRNHLITPMVPFGNFDFTYTPEIDIANTD